MRLTTSKEERRASREASKTTKHAKAGRPAGSYTAPDTVTCRIPAHHYRAIRLMADARGESFVQTLAKCLSRGIPAELGDANLHIPPEHVL